MSTPLPCKPPDVLISEVGPRDGLQSVARTMPTPHKLTIPLSAGAAHSLANVGKTREQMLAELREIVALRHDLAPQVVIEAGISTAFGCTLQGAVAEDDVVWLAEAAAAAGVDEAGLSDTTGMAQPAQVRRLFNRVRAAIGNQTDAAHLHNTRGLGLANGLAAWDVGVRTFDASQGGLGGCPHAPGASGNVVTEDLVYLFEAMGVATGVDLHRLVAARTPLLAGLPGEPLYGMVPEAGLPSGFVYADGRQPDGTALLQPGQEAGA